MKQYLVAIPIDDAQITATREDYAVQDTGLRPHITLVQPFAMALHDDVVNRIRDAAEQVREFCIRTSGVNAFHNERDIVFLRVVLSPELEQLQEGIRSALPSIEFTSVEYDFNPHITICRCDLNQAQNIIDALPKNWCQEIKCTSFSLYCRNDADEWQEIAAFLLTPANA